MRIPIMLSSMTAGLLLSAPALAGVGQGDFELGINVSVTKQEITIADTTTKSDFGNIGAGFGYFIDDMIELKGAVSMTVTDAGNFGVFSPGADFVFMGKEKVAPFVGLAYGLAFGDSTGVDSDFIDLHGGVKFFISERASLELRLNRFDPTDSASPMGRTELTAGINIYY